ncbi:8-amino-7-oxononanoate synthase-like [Pistacia vera]|uniref:8-amino-7-oxononanoate synthase-like n=1 Tax=Pistacia vera TaxID=55513 RepID=UPI001263A99E|nr:8-amino-7-oxononanoate synthase-like [Pistacia vera]
MVELVKLRKKYGFLLVLDDAHGTFFRGKSGGGVAEEFNCERDIDICIGTLSKAAGYHGGFISCRPTTSKRRKQFIQSRGRSFIFSTSASILIAAAVHVLPLYVSSHDRELNSYSKLSLVRGQEMLHEESVCGSIVPLQNGSEEKALLASRHLLESGFHVTTIRLPTIPSNSCRLQVTLTAVHTTDV